MKKELTSEQQTCNCSPFDLARFGCRYLQKVDSNQIIHC